MFVRVFREREQRNFCERVDRDREGIREKATGIVREKDIGAFSNPFTNGSCSILTDSIDGERTRCGVIEIFVDLPVMFENVTVRKIFEDVDYSEGDLESAQFVLCIDGVHRAGNSRCKEL